MAYASWSVVFGEQPSAAKWNILGANDASFNDGTGIGASAITPEKLFTGTGTTWPWTSYVPVFANTTLGNGTVTGKFKQVGKTVVFRATFTLGNSSAVGSAPTVSLPVTAVTQSAFEPIGIFGALDAEVALFPGYLSWTSTTVAQLFVNNSASTYAVATGLSSTVPHAWGTGDAMYVSGVYEAA